MAFVQNDIFQYDDDKEFFDILETKRVCRLWKISYICTLKCTFNNRDMVIISSAELRNNMKKYLDIAKKEKVVIQRGRNETFVLVAQNNAAEEDLNRAITIDEVLARVREGLNEMLSARRAIN